MLKPKLRPLEAIPFRQRGRLFVQLHDPTRISDKLLIIPHEMLFLLSLFDGTNSIPDIQAAIMRQFGELVLSEKIQEVLDQLDDALMLDSPRFHAHMAQLAEEFRNSPTRLPCSAGAGYPADPTALTQFLNELMAEHGQPRAVRRASALSPLVGLIAPHIDFHRGGPSYAHAYKALAEGCEADLFVIFGTAHFAKSALFTLTHKSFQTPLGTLATNAELVDAVVRRGGGKKLLAEELLHKNEHSIEFQVVCLQHVLRGRPIEMLPILCGPLESAVGDKESPRQVAAVSDFLDALREVLAESGRRVCAIAGADLAHVGAAFGHDFPLTPEVMADVERADRETLAYVERLDPDGFHRSVQADGNARHICGASAIYALLATVQASRCTLLDYRQATDYDAQRAVTFASLALYA